MVYHFCLAQRKSKIVKEIILMILIQIQIIFLHQSRLTLLLEREG